MNTLQVAAQVSLFNVIESSIHSVSNHPPSSLRFGLLSPPGLTAGIGYHSHPITIVVTTASLGLRLWPAGSPQREAESSSFCYGLVVHLQLLSTPPHGDAVTFSYRVQTKL